MSIRLIHLRRPAVLQVQDEPYVPPRASLDEIDERWNRLCESNPAYFDGRIYHVLGVHRNGYGGAVIHVRDCSYRFHAVQGNGYDLGVRPLGAKGIVERNGKYLLGKRSDQVAHYQGLWEFAPAGVVDAGKQPSEVIINELEEELGIQASREPTPIAVIYDDYLLCWEIVFRITLEKDQSPQVSSNEYDEIQWLSKNELPANLSAIAKQMVSLI